MYNFHKSFCKGFLIGTTCICALAIVWLLLFRPCRTRNEAQRLKDTYAQDGRVAKREVATRPYFVRKSCYRLEIVENSRRYSEKSVQKASPRGYSDAKCGKVFDFCIHAVIFSDTRVFSLPCSRFIHSFFRSKAIASKNSSARIFALPRVRNRRKAKSFFKSPNAPST